MKKTLVRYEIDLANPPPLTETQKAELAALAAMPDEDIDYSDIPPLPDSFFANAVRGMFKRRREASTRSASTPSDTAPARARNPHMRRGE